MGVSDPITAPSKLYRVLSFPDTDDLHLDGLIAQALRSTVFYGDLQTVFGLGAGPPASPVLVVRDKEGSAAPSPGAPATSG